MHDLVEATTKPKVRYSQKSVLIIEDFAEFARALRGMMTTLGCKHVDLSYNGEDALQACKEKKYDIILSDYNLGESKDGQQLLEELNHYSLLKSNTVFLIITAENATAMVMGALEYQPDSYLTKPFNNQILKARLDRAIVKKDLLAPIVRNIRKKKWQDAIALCNEIQEETPKYRMACLRHKFTCFKGLKQFDKALELTTNIINERPIPWAMLGVGEIFYLKKTLDRAIDLFNDMVKEFPMVMEGYDWLAKLLYQTGLPVEAQNVLLEAVERSPKALQRQKLLGQIAEENEDLETMTQAFRQAIRFGKNSAFASPDEFIKLTKSLGLQINGVSTSDRKKLIDEAESVFSNLNERFKANPKVQFRGAVAHADFSSITNDDAGVKKYLKSANKYYDRIEEILGSKESIEISESLKQLGQSELAECILEEAVEQYFDDPKFIKQAQKLTNNKHLIANSQKANQFNNNAIQYFKARDFSAAIEFFSKAGEIAPNNVNINLNHVQALLKRAQVAENKTLDLEAAEQILTRVTRLGPDDARYSRYSELNRLTQLMIQNL